MANVFAKTGGCGLVWTLQRARLAAGFDRILVLRSGRIVESGAFADLCGREDGASKTLLDEE